MTKKNRCPIKCILGILIFLILLCGPAALKNVFAEESAADASGKIRVYVYVSASGISNEMLDLLGIDPDTLDVNGYFPAGEIELEESYLEGKDAETEDAPLINSEADWETMLAALSDMDTGTLTGIYEANQGNHVADYLEQAERDIGYSSGSDCSALFRWNETTSYGFEDQTVQYHLDLRFSTKTITFIIGDSGIESGAVADNTIVETRTYITGSVIQEPRDMEIPEGYQFEGYYADPEYTTVWDGVGTSLNTDQTVYIKIKEIEDEATDEETEDETMSVVITTEVSGEDEDQDKYITFIVTDENGNCASSDGNSEGTILLRLNGGVDHTCTLSGLVAGSVITLYVFGTDEYDSIEVEYNGTEVEKNEDGSYSICLESGAQDIAITNTRLAVDDADETSDADPHIVFLIGLLTGFLIGLLLGILLFWIITSIRRHSKRRREKEAGEERPVEENMAGGNMTGGNMAGENMAGGNMTGGNMAGENVAGGNMTGGNMAGENVAGGNMTGGNMAGGHMTGENVAGGNTTGRNMAGGYMAGGSVYGGKKEADSNPGTYRRSDASVGIGNRDGQ